MSGNPESSASGGLWSYFKRGPEKLATCNLCEKTLSYKTTITNLKQHLNRVHISTYTILYGDKNTAGAASTGVQDTEETQPASPESCTSEEVEEKPIPLAHHNIGEPERRSSKRTLDPLDSDVKRTSTRRTKIEVKNANETPIDYSAKAWVGTLKELPKEQQIFATKIINQVLFEAQMQNLNRHTHLTALNTDLQSTSSEVTYVQIS